MTPPTLTEPAPAPAPLPPVVQSQTDASIVHRGSWLTTIAPAFLGVFVWVPFLDQMGAAGHGAAGLLGPFLSALLALIAAYLLLYVAPTRLGWSTGQRLSVVASSSLGTEGAEWITGVLYGLFGLVWWAVSVYFSVKLILLGLLSWDLIDVAAVQRGSLGSLTLESPLFLVCLAFWTLIIASANGLRLMSVIASLLKVYAPVAALLIVLAAAWAWTHPTGEVAPTVRSPESGLIDPSIFQLVFGYFAFAGLMGVEWGAAVRERRDVRIGGWLGVLAAGAVTAASALILGANDPGTMNAVGGLGWDIPSGSFQGAIYRGISATAGSKAAGLLLLLFGVAALAPACYGAAIYSERFRAHWPLMQGRAGLCLAYAVVIGLGATALSARLETIFTISGALFAPVAGVMSAESLLRRGRWRGIRTGWRLPGVLAWGLGCLIGLTPLLGKPHVRQPIALFAYLAAAIEYGVVVAARSKPIEDAE